MEQSQSSWGNDTPSRPNQAARIGEDSMFGTILSPAIRWIAAILLVLATIFGIYYKGRLDERKLFNAYKAEVKAAALAQEEKTRQIEAKNERLFKETQNAYNTKLNALRAYYSMRISGQSGSGLSKVPNAAIGVNGTATYELPPLPPVETLAAQCAESTLMLTTLQDWVKGVYNNQ